MAYEIPETEPESFVSGDTVKWYKTLDDFLPTAGWTLKYYLVQSGEQQVVTASDNGDGKYLVSIAKATTAAYTAGTVSWNASVDDGTDRHTIDAGTFQILPDIAAQVSGYDDRTHAKKVLDAIEAVLEGRATKDQEAYELNGRRLERTPVADLIMLRSTYKREVAQEEAAEKAKNGIGGHNIVRVRMP